MGRGDGSGVTCFANFIDQHRIYVIRRAEQLVIEHKLLWFGSVCNFSKRGC